MVLKTNPSLEAILCLLTAAFFTACMEGPQGPAGKDGKGAGVLDSIVFDGLEPFLYWNRHDTGFTLSPEALARYAKMDTSKFLIETVRYENGNLVKTLFLRTRYDPAEWKSSVHVTAAYVLQDSAAPDWFARLKNRVWARRPVPVDFIGYGPLGDHYPGKGFDLYYATYEPYEGTIKVYYWK